MSRAIHLSVSPPAYSDGAIDEAGISRGEVYITNAVKHYRWEPCGKRRLYKKPSARQIRACRPWLDAEIEMIELDGIVCLGTTAAQAMMGRSFRIAKQRGKFLQSDQVACIVATYHPSALSRAPNREEREPMRDLLVTDLAKAHERVSRPQ